jgi:DNA-binding LacI/PurR family transcriptional regulator
MPPGLRHGRLVTLLPAVAALGMAGPEGDASSADKVLRPTTADVARRASVSTATVSYVLNNAQGRRISPQTRAAVRRAAAELGYRPNLAARNLASGKSGVVLYVVPRVAVGEMPMAAGSRMTTALAQQGIMQIQIFQTDDDQHVIDAVADLNPIAVTSLFPLGKGVKRAVDIAGIPYIEIGGLPALGAPQSSVGEMRVGHLASRGHRRLAFAYTGIAKWRPLGDYWLDGVARAAQKRGLPAPLVAEVTVDNAADVVRSWREDGVTAVCAQSDEVAFVVLHGIREAGLRCPTELAVIGVDASPAAAVSYPPLTTVEFNTAAVADAAVDAVLDKLGLHTIDTAGEGEIAHLVVRAST